MVEVEFHDVFVRLISNGGAPVRLSEPSRPTLAVPLRAAVLKERGGERALAIWMGNDDALALVTHKAGLRSSRPLPSEVMLGLLEATGARVEQVAISEYRENVFFSSVSVRAGDRRSNVDARPSDALNLAVRVGAPILVDQQVMVDHAVPIGELSDRLEDLERNARGQTLEQGEWRSLSPDLIRTLEQQTGAE